MWLREGDQNSKFFHNAAKTRRKINQITSLVNEAGQTTGWDNGLQNTMLDYFTDLFNATETEWNGMFEGGARRISQAHNVSIMAPIDYIEVKRALFSMHPDKSPGPDGFSPGFYQKFWSIVSTDMVELVQNFFLNGKLENHLGDANIVLIPKKKNHVSMKDLRPISL